MPRLRLSAHVWILSILSTGSCVSWHLSHPHVLLLWPGCRRCARCSSMVTWSELGNWIQNDTLESSQCQRLTVLLSRSICLAWELQLDTKPALTPPQHSFMCSVQKSSGTLITKCNHRLQCLVSLPQATIHYSSIYILYIMPPSKPLQDPDSQKILKYEKESTGTRGSRDLNSDTVDV